MKIRVRLATLVAIIASLTLVACSSEGSTNSSSDSGNGEKGAVALSFGGLDITLWNDIIKLVEPEVNDAGYELLVDDPQWDVQKQISDWQAWVTRGDVKSMVAFPIQADALVPQTKAMVDAGIPVIGYSTQWPGVEHFMAAEHYKDGVKMGEAAGEWIMENYGESPVHVALLVARELDLGRLRADGALEGLKNSVPNVIVDELSGASREDGQANTERQLVAHPDTKIWLSTLEDNLLGTYRVLMDKGVDPKDPKVMLGSMDVTNASIDIIKEPDSIYRLAYVFPAQPIADAIVESLITAAEGGDVQDIRLVGTRVTADTAMDYYLDE